MSRRRSKRTEVTIRDVAASSGVSMMTVSNVINGNFTQMRANTRSRVEQAIAKLNYRPHQMARNLRRSERLSIGLLFIDDEQTFFSHPGHSYVIAGLSNFLNERGYSLTLQGLDPTQIEAALPIKNVGTDALCIVQSGSLSRRQRTFSLLSELNQPCVLIHETTVPKNLDSCCIHEDDLHGGRLIARHLIERGCRSLLLVLPTTVWASMEARAAGVTTECRKHGIRLQRIRCASSRVEDVDAALTAFCETTELPSGLVGGNDQIGMAALQFLKRRHIDVPKRVRVTGFNAFEFWKYSDPLLTTIRAPATAMGIRAGEELIRRLTTGSFSARQIVFPIEIIIGQST